MGSGAGSAGAGGVASGGLAADTAGAGVGGSGVLGGGVVGWGVDGDQFPVGVGLAGVAIGTGWLSGSGLIGSMSAISLVVYQVTARAGMSRPW